MSALRRMAPAICLLLICMACARGTRPRRPKTRNLKGRIVTQIKDTSNILFFPYRARAWAIPARQQGKTALLQSVLAQPDRPIIEVLREHITKGEHDK